MCMMMFAWKDTAAGEVVQKRIGVAPRDKHSFARFARLIPQHGNPMRRVLAAESGHARQSFGTDVFEPDQTNARDGRTRVQLGTEPGRQLALHHFRVNPEVDQDSPSNQALYLGKTHAVLLIAV